MNKDEILEASREENNNKDLAEIEIENKAVKFGALSMLILSTIYFCLEIFIKGETNYGWYSIISFYCTILYGYKALKDKKTIHIINFIIWLLVSVITIYKAIRNIYLTSAIL